MDVFRVTGDGRPDLFYATQTLATTPAIERSGMSPEKIVEIHKFVIPKVNAQMVANMLSGFGGWYDDIVVVARYKNGVRI